MYYITLTKSRIAEIAEHTRRELLSRGYTASCKDLKTQAECILDALHVLAWAEDADAYAPIHATAYYRDNGCAYLAAQDIIFGMPDIKRLQCKALSNRREIMKEKGIWTEAHEREYLRKTV